MGEYRERLVASCGLCGCTSERPTGTFVACGEVQETVPVCLDCCRLQITDSKEFFRLVRRRWRKNEEQDDDAAT